MKEKIFAPVVIVASLGYFVDIYDLILFNVVKKSSLEALGLSGQALIDEGLLLFNIQMLGMLVGGLLWGIYGDKKGRVKVLFGSILLYSLANIANAFVSNVTEYAVIRFIAGLGLAGELGAGITLVSETLSKEKRGYGTMILVTFGALGAVFAALVAGKTDWQTSYIVGGVLGLLLLFVRMGTLESKIFIQSHKRNAQQGNFLRFLSNWHNARLYLQCILIGLPVWFVIGLPIALAENFAQELLVAGPVSTGTAIMFAYIGLSLGDLISGILSQWFKSRKKVVYLYLILCGAFSLVFLTMKGISPSFFYATCLMLGIATGYWALFVTIAAEQFGTNIRSTVTTTVPNFVRGAVWPITALFKFLQPHSGMIYSAAIVGAVCILLALWSAWSVEETFGKDLNYLEAM